MRYDPVDVAFKKNCFKLVLKTNVITTWVQSSLAKCQHLKIWPQKMQISFQCSNGQKVSENSNMAFLIPPNVIKTMSLSMDFKQTLSFCCGCKTLRQNFRNWTVFSDRYQYQHLKDKYIFYVGNSKHPW